MVRNGQLEIHLGFGFAAGVSPEGYEMRAMKEDALGGGGSLSLFIFMFPFGLSRFRFASWVLHPKA